MSIFIVLSVYVLVLSCSLPDRCDGCLNMFLKSLYQVFNPTVETGPGRLIARHRYADGFMPDYPVADGGGRYVYGEPADWDDVPTAYYGGGRGPGKNAVRTRAAIIGRDYRDVRDDGDQSLMDFIASLLRTIQLTPRAVLKKSRSKSATHRPAPGH